jgi:acyl-CoA synthetase (AMP-forming)/AMP-acid ligase II
VTVARFRDRVPVPAESPATGRTLADLVDAHAAWNPDRVALIDEDGEHTYAAVRDRVEALAHGLVAQGVGHGGVVAVADDPARDVVALYLATARIGAVLVPLNTRLRAPELREVLDRTRPDLVLTSAAHGGLVGDALPPDVPAPLAGAPHARWGDLLVTDTVGPLPRGGPGDPHLVLFTSGTTGRPKAAVLGQRRSVGDAANAALASGVRADDRLLGYQPLYHTGGWDFLKQYLLVGGSVVLMSKFDPDRALELLERHRCTSMFAVPLVLLRLLESPRFARTDLSAFRRLMFASYEPSTLVPRAVRAFARRGARNVRVEHVYGQTEAGSFVTTLRAEDATDDRLDSIGTPVPGVTVALLDPDLNPVPRGEVGEICVRAETVMTGYLDDPTATDEAFRGGWLHTGDLGRQSPDGLLRIAGRLKEMIRTAGENVFPKEVEGHLVAHPEVVDCVVFGVPDPRWDERVVAAVVPVPGSRLTEADLVAYLRERIAGFKVPREVHLVTELPKTPAGKTERHRLREFVAVDPNRSQAP